MKTIKQLLKEAPLPAERKHLKNKQWKWPDEIVSYLKDQGFKQIGEGLYSIAFSKPSSKKVIKLSKRSDACWLKFAKWAKGKRSIHLPKIYDIVEYKSELGQKLFISVVEKLTAVDIFEHEWTGKNKDILAWLIHNEVIDIKETHHIRSEVADILEFEYSKNTVDYNRKIEELSNRFEKSNNSFAKMYKRVKRSIGRQCDMDIHDGNIYYRKSSNSFVILDPYAYK